MIDLIQTRRDLHQIPELALNETETHDYLLQVIAQLPQTWLTVRTIKVLPTAILVHITGSQPTQTLGYRADMDALPVDETTELPFSSTHAGISHACGHDLHMTVALGILAHFATHQPKDNLIFFFQPAEESHSGGKIAYDADALPVIGTSMNSMVCMTAPTYPLAPSPRASVPSLRGPAKSRSTSPVAPDMRRFRRPPTTWWSRLPRS